MAKIQPIDYTTLRAVRTELCKYWLPARTEQVYQCDRHTLAIALRTLKKRDWLTISWHPEAARIHIGDAPPRTPDTFTFSDQLRHQLNGYALIAIAEIAPWERVLDLQFAQRPGDAPVWHLYVEIMGKYSNVILTDAEGQIITVAHQVSAAQSSFRTVQTGQVYQLPPSLTAYIPQLSESQTSWQQRVSLIPGEIKRQLLRTYRGLSPCLLNSMLAAAGIEPNQSSENLKSEEWHNLFTYWRKWLETLQKGSFQPGYAPWGYDVLGWKINTPAKNVQTLLNSYYKNQVNQQTFQQLRHQLLQKINNSLKKLRIKFNNFQERLQQSNEADEYRQKADLLMAHLHLWQPGMKSITLVDFATNKPLKISLNPEKNGVRNAQYLYKQHQKLKRAKGSVEPLLKEVQEEINYLEQVESSIIQLENYGNSEDLPTILEIKEELIEQKYIQEQQFSRSSNNKNKTQPHRYLTPSGFELLIGRNNRQNDRLTFRTAGDYDLWFHTQEIPGSHLLLRLEPGAIAEETDLQFAADLAAYYSRARESDQVPVVYTQPKHIYKPKGAKPGIAIYKQEKIIWGRPQWAKKYLQDSLKSANS